jgi:hypothetical protein
MKFSKSDVPLKNLRRIKKLNRLRLSRIQVLNKVLNPQMKSHPSEEKSTLKDLKKKMK